jgi:hypothetical protein
MPKCRTVWHPVSPVLNCKKLTMQEQVRYWTKLSQSGIISVWYWTKIQDAGMPALVSSMQMPSYDKTSPVTKHHQSQNATICIKYKGKIWSFHTFIFKMIYW